MAANPEEERMQSRDNEKPGCTIRPNYGTFAYPINSDGAAASGDSDILEKMSQTAKAKEIKEYIHDWQGND